MQAASLENLVVKQSQYSAAKTMRLTSWVIMMEAPCKVATSRAVISATITHASH